MPLAARIALTTVAFVVAFGVAGCVTRPLEQRYSQLSWAKMSVYQADAECRVEQQKNMLMGLNICMRAKGWEAQ